MSFIKPQLLAFLAVFLFSAAFAPHAFAGTGGGPDNYSYAAPAWYSGGDGTELGDYPIGTRNAVPLLQYIQHAEVVCHLAGYQACTMTVKSVTSGGCPTSGDIQAPCYTIDLVGNTQDQSKPTSHTGTGSVIYYAITDIVTDISASPSSIQQGESTTLTWTTSNEYVGSTDPSKCTINNGIGAVSPSGSKSVSPTVTTTYSITCNDGASDDPDQASDSVTVTVSGGTQPDLIASDVSTDPASPVVNESTKLTATITNQGDAPTGAGFTDLYEIDNDSDHDTLFATVTDTSPALDAGGTDPSQVTYTFPTKGTWYIRACADKRDQNDVDGVVVESNENNNCSADWASVTVTDAAEPNLTATYGGPSQADDGTAATLIGTIENPGNASTVKSFKNVFEINPDHTTDSFDDIHALRTVTAGPLDKNGHQGVDASYTFNNEFDGWSGTSRIWYVRLCADTDTSNNGTIDESDEGDNCGVWTPVTVVSSGDECGTHGTGTMTADPTRVATGTPSTLSWANVVDVPAGLHCDIESTPQGNDSGDLGKTSDSCTLSNGHWKSNPINTQTSFQLFCGGQAVTGASAVVDVAPLIQEF